MIKVLIVEDSPTGMADASGPKGRWKKVRRSTSPYDMNGKRGGRYCMGRPMPVDELTRWLSESPWGLKGGG